MINLWHTQDREDEQMAELKLTNIQKAYGDVKVLHGIDLHIQPGEFIVFVGPLWLYIENSRYATVNIHKIGGIQSPNNIFVVWVVEWNFANSE